MLPPQNISSLEKLHIGDKIQPIGNEKLHIGDEKPHIEGEQPSIDPEKPLIEEVLTRLGFTRPTEENIIKLIRRFGFVDIFGRREVRDTTGHQDRASSALIGQMLRNRLLDTVKGHGKGKYRFRAAALASDNHACAATSTQIVGHT